MRQEVMENAQHEAGSILRAWTELAAAVESIVHCLRAEPEVQRPSLLQALAFAVARGMEVELFDASAINGLSWNGGAGSTGAGRPMPDPNLFSAGARAFLFISTLHLLWDAGALHRVGEAFLRGGAMTVNLLVGLQDLPTSAVSSLSSRAPIQRANASNSGDSTGMLLLWLVESLIEIGCEAAQKGDVHRVRATLELCCALGGSTFAWEVRSAPSHSKIRRGASPAHLATIGGHDKVKRLLAEWPDVDDASVDVFRFPDDDSASQSSGQRQRRRSGSVRRTLSDAGSAVQNAFSTAVGSRRTSNGYPPRSGVGSG